MSLRARNARVHVRRGTIVLNTPIDGGPGVYLSAVPVPKLGPSPASTFYLMGLAAALATLAIAYGIYRSRLGVGLFAIHDDEDVAEVLGCRPSRVQDGGVRGVVRSAGVAGGMHALFVSYVTAGDTFTITVPLTVVLMSVLGGTRHWAVPPSATIITALLYAFTAGNLAVAGKAVFGAVLIVVILFMPQACPAVFCARRRKAGAGDSRSSSDEAPATKGFTQSTRSRRRAHPWWRAASEGVSGACAHWTASTSTCEQGKFWSVGTQWIRQIDVHQSRQRSYRPDGGTPVPGGEDIVH